jgi:hypothetical protein
MVLDRQIVFFVQNMLLTYENPEKLGLKILNMIFYPFFSTRNQYLFYKRQVKMGFFVWVQKLLMLFQ